MYSTCVILLIKRTENTCLSQKVMTFDTLPLKTKSVLHVCLILWQLWFQTSSLSRLDLRFNSLYGLNCLYGQLYLQQKWVFDLSCKLQRNVSWFYLRISVILVNLYSRRRKWNCSFPHKIAFSLLLDIKAWNCRHLELLTMINTTCKGKDAKLRK